MNLNEEQKNQLRAVAEKYKIRLFVLFGSTATGKTHKTSDADIAYLSARALTIREEAEIIIALSPILKNNRIDLVNLHRAPPLLLYAITKDGKTLYATDPLEFYGLCAYAFKRYIEAKPLFRLKNERLKLALNI